MKFSKLVQKQYKTKVLIIGSGPAGYSASIYSGRSALQPILVSGHQPGGQLTITTDVENYPGFSRPIMGPWLMEEMKKQSQLVKVQIIEDIIASVNFKFNPFLITGCNGNEYFANSVIIATGAEAKWIGLRSEKQFMGFGVSGCATCDGFFFKNKNVFVVGGGNSAIEEALHLANHESKVTVIHRKNKFRAEKILQDRLFKHQKINVIFNAILINILGKKEPLSVKTIQVKTFNTQYILKIQVDGLFIAVGHKPNTDLFKNELIIDPEGFIVTYPNSTKTNIEGIFAAGDVQDKIFRQAVTAAGTGCMASLEALKFLDLC